MYTAGPLNTLLWGCESWNMIGKNIRRLNGFHHKAIKRILGLRWECVKEERIMNEEVRYHFNNIPNIESFIIRRTHRYIGKIMRSEKNNIPWKPLGAWIHCPRKTGRLLNSCNNNLFMAIRVIVPDVEKNDKFQSWAVLASNENSWNN